MQVDLNRKEAKMRSLITLIMAGLLIVTGIGTACAGDAVKVNINTASADELARLSGVGPRHAAGIIEFRQKNGPFKSPEELIQVSGIGPKTLEKNKELIVVEGSGRKPTKK